MRIHRLNGMSLLTAAVALGLCPTMSKAQTRVRDGVYYYPPSSHSSVLDDPRQPPSTRAVLGIPDAPYYPRSYYEVPTYFNRPTYMTSINYPWLYGGHFYMGGSQGSGLLESFPRSYESTGSTFNPDAPLPSYNSLRSVSGVNGASTLRTAGTARATINVRVPADAEVWFQGQRMTPTGTLRHFYSPPLTADTDFQYEVRALWSRSGEPVSVNRTVSVRAGEHLEVDLTAPPKSSSTSTLRTGQLPEPSSR